MALTLADTQTLITIIAASLTVLGTIGGWVALSIRRQWSSTEDAYTERIGAMKDDHDRDIQYYERQAKDHKETIKELKEDMKDLRDRLERCEDRWNNPPSFQV